MRDWIWPRVSVRGFSKNRSAPAQCRAGVRGVGRRVTISVALEQNGLELAHHQPEWPWRPARRQ